MTPIAGSCRHGETNAGEGGIIVACPVAVSRKGDTPIDETKSDKETSGSGAHRDRRRAAFDSGVAQASDQGADDDGAQVE